jgi:ATP-dependent protease ClpP protease subunit
MIKELNIFGDIVSVIENVGEVSPLSVKNEINGLTQDDELVVNIDCYGGEVFAAVAISSMIHSLPSKKTFNILGICASAATMLFDENDIVNISKGAMLMYHKPMIGAYGNAKELKTQIDKLDKIENENILKPLINRTGNPLSELMTLIENEWWLTSDEAILNLGFVN